MIGCRARGCMVSPKTLVHEGLLLFEQIWNGRSAWPGHEVQLPLCNVLGASACMFCPVGPMGGRYGFSIWYKLIASFIIASLVSSFQSAAAWMWCLFVLVSVLLSLQYCLYNNCICMSLNLHVNSGRCNALLCQQLCCHARQ